MRDSAGHPGRLRLRRGLRRTRLAARRRRSTAGDRLSRAEQRARRPAEPGSRHSQTPRLAYPATGLGAFRRGRRASFDRRHRSALRAPGRAGGDHLRRDIRDPTQHHRRATARIAEGMTMDYDLGTDAVELRKRLRELISIAHPRRLPGRLHQRPQRPGDHRVVLQNARLRRAAGPGLAERTRRWRRFGVAADCVARGDVGPPRTPRRPVHGHQLGRAGAHAVRNRRAEGPAPARHRGR